MTYRHASAIALASLSLALAACRPAADTPPEATAPTPAEAAAPVEAGSVVGTDATAVVHHEQADPAGFDRKAFAGTFSGTVPCADCPGIDTELVIDADGGFRLSESYQDSDVRRETTGTWTIDADGRRLQLDPGTKEDADRWFGIVSKDEIRMLDTEGNPIESALNYSLRRG